MKILITDWGEYDQVLPIALKYQVGMELLDFSSPDDLERGLADRREAMQQARSLPLLGVHGPFSELVPATRDALVRQVTRKRFQQGYEIAQELGASHYILHSGFIPKTYPRDMWLQSSLAFWSEFLADKPRKDMIHVENVYEDDYTCLVELADRVNQAFGEERLTLCLDIGHVNANSSKTLREWITALGDRIRYTHLHNNAGTLDDHWRLDKGEIDVREILDLLQQRAPHALWNIETGVEDIEPSLQWMQENGYLSR